MSDIYLTGNDSPSYLAHHPTDLLSPTTLRVLLADGDGGYRRTVRNTLATAALEIQLREVVTGPEVMLALIETEYDLLLTEHTLPGFACLQVLDEVRALRPHLPIIVMTATGSEELAVAAMKRGATDYLAKRPYHLRQLPTLIASCIVNQPDDHDEARSSDALKTAVRQQVDGDYDAMLTILAKERGQRRLAETLREVATALSASLDREQLLTVILDQLARVVSYMSASVMLISGDSLISVARRPNDRRQAASPTRIAILDHLQEVLEWRQPVIIADTKQDVRWANLPGTDEIRCWFGVPLVAQDRVIGLLNLTYAEPDFYTARDAEIAMIFANQAATAIQNAHLYEAARRRARELDLLNRIIAVAARSEGETLEAGCAELARFFSARRVTATLLDDDDRRLNVVAEFRPREDVSHIGQRLMVADDAALRRVLTRGEPVVETAVDSSRRLVAPLSVRERVVGTIHIDLSGSQVVSSEERRLAALVGDELGRALETARLYSRLSRHAADLEKRVAERTRALAEANERLTELDQLKSRFITDISHELRTPVSNLNLYLNLLERGKPEKHDHYLNVLNSQTRRLERLIESILEITRLEREAGSMDLQPVDLNRLAADVVETFRETAAAARLALHFRPSPGERVALAERERLARVFSILVENAINYTVEGEVVVSTAAAGKEVGFEVADTGIGIDPVDLDYLFDRFYRGQHGNQMNIPGHGLGLSLAREIVAVHNGRLVVESTVGEGSRFTVWLPSVS